MHQSPDGVIRQFVPLIYEKRKFPKLFFKGRIIYGDYHGMCHRALLDIGYTHAQIDGWQPEALIAEFERVRNKINGDF